MIKVKIVALSISKETLETHFIRTFYEKFKPIEGINIECIIYAQGFDYETSQYIKIIRDDSHYRKGLKISEIREYFTSKFLKDYPDTDYILFADDDFKFNTFSFDYLKRDIEYMESHPEAGVLNLRHVGKFLEETTRHTVNPTTIAMCSGILVRPSAYFGWGGDGKVEYCEEAVIATLAYYNGYDIVHSFTDTIHITKSTGLGATIRDGKGDDLVHMYNVMSGKKYLFLKGLVTTRVINGIEDFRHTCRMSKECNDHHNRSKINLKKF